MQIPRAHHRDRELHELRRLEADEAQAQPALRTQSDVTEGGHNNQQEDANDIQPRSGAAQEIRADSCQHQHRDCAENQTQHGADDGGDVLAGSAVQHDQAVNRDQSQADDQRPIDIQLEQHARRTGQGAPGA